MFVEEKTVSEGYKMTELGEIPVEWEVKTIEDVASNEKSAIKIGPFGSQLKKEFLVESGYKVYGQENVFLKDFDIGNRYITTEKFSQLKSCELKPNDFVITMMGTIGKCGIVPFNIEKGIMDSHLLRIRLNPRVYINDLLIHCISSDLVQNQIKRLSVGGIMAGLSSKVIRQIMLPVPSIEEQQKIAEILSTVDEQIEITEQLIEQTKELKKGLMQQLLTKGIGHLEFKMTEIGEIPVSWEIKQIVDLFNVRKETTNDVTEYPLFSLTIESGLISKPDQYERSFLLKNKEGNKYSLVYPGDIVINPMNLRWGAIAVLEEINPVSVSAYYNTIYVKEHICIVDYYKFLLTSEKMINLYDRISTGTLNEKKRVHLSQFIKISVPYPPIKEQQHIAEVLTSVDEQIESYKQEKVKYKELKQGLMQQLLTGKVRVRG